MIGIRKQQKPHSLCLSVIEQKWNLRVCVTWCGSFIAQRKTLLQANNIKNLQLEVNTLRVCFKKKKQVNKLTLLIQK